MTTFDDPKNHSFVFAQATVIDVREDPPDLESSGVAFCAWRWNTTRLGPPTPPVYDTQQLNPGPVSFFPYPVRDPNNLPLTFSLVTPLPANLQINPSTGEIYGTLVALDWNITTCQVQVSNGTFTITGPVFSLYSYAIGGVETRSTVYGIEYNTHTFNFDDFAVSGQTTVPFTVNRDLNYVEYLIVGGGGGGGTYIGGGGGGGGVRVGTTSYGVGAYTATVGGGGDAAANGGDSGLGSVIAVGGGAGGSSGSGFNSPGVSSTVGGSGGGGGITQYYNTIISNALNTVASNNQLGSAGTAGQGYAGGSGIGGNSAGGSYDPSYSAKPSGGGGGAGQPGANGAIVNLVSVAGKGGDGVGLTFAGSLTYYGGGGGGGTSGAVSSVNGAGGLGGGGSVSGGVNGVNGRGGGGAGGTTSVGGRGGHGVVIIRYPLYPEPAGVKRFGLVQWLDAVDYTSGAIIWDDRTANYDASMFNAPVQSPDGGGSIQFNGTTNLGTYDLPAEVSPVGSYSLELWAKWTSVGTTASSIQTILDNASTTTAPSFVLQDRPDAGKVLSFEYQQSSGSTTLRSTSVIGDGAWHHIVVSCDFNTPAVRLYIDGTLENTVPSPSQSNRVIKSTMTIGRWDAGVAISTPRYFGGKLAILRTYSRALSLDDAVNNYLTEAARFGSAAQAAYGGTIITYVLGDTTYRAHVFSPSALDASSPGTLTVLSPIASADYMLLGGGGGGGAAGGGGGGSGGLLIASRAFAVGSFAVGSGSGGAGSTSNVVRGSNGYASSLDGVSVLGGGGGASRLGGLNAGVGGSGGGGSGQVEGTLYLGAAGTAGQGSAGGNGTGPTDAGSNAGGGGGGGTGGAGAAAAVAVPLVSSTIAGAGGIGTLVTLTGVRSYYGAGGGGGLAANGTIGSGGLGGGGAGSASAGVDGTANSGSGGGGGGNTGGRGGSGLVLVRYPTGSAAPVVDPNSANAVFLIPGLGYPNSSVSNWRDFAPTPEIYSPVNVANFSGSGDYLTVLAGTAADPYAYYVRLLLHCDGVNGSTSFPDSSLSSTTITANGNVQVSTARSKWGTASALFDGTGDQLTFSAISIGTNEDCTFECWVYKTAIDASGYTVVFGGLNQNIQFAFDYTGVAGAVGLVLHGVSIIPPSGTAVTLNTWHHLAWSRQGSTWRVFVNGVLQGTGSTNATFDVYRIGAFEAGGYEMNGNIDDVRITKGICRYTENFTPPTGPFPDPASNFAFGTGDFTVEGWFYATSNNRLLFDTRPTSTQGLYPTIDFDSASRVSFFQSSAYRILSPSVQLNAWTHFAVVRKSAVTTLFVNGLPVGFYADTNNYGFGQLVGVGTQTFSLGTSTWAGSLSNFRVTKGVARYEPTYTQPTAELPDRAAATSGDASFASVSALLRMAGPVGGTSFVDSSLNALAVTRLGSAVIADLSPFSGSRSVTFSASSDYLSVAGGSHFTFPADFTIEVWAYLTATGPRAGTDDGYGGAAVFSCTNGGTPATVLTYFNIGTYRANLNDPITAWAFTYNVTGSQPSSALVGNTVPQTNVWTHIAVSRSGNTLRLFVNGTLEATATVAGTFNNTAFSPRVGVLDYTYPRALQGNVGEIRVTKGVARYTANFTRPTASFPSTVAAAAADPYYAQDVLLLRGNGTNGSTNFADLGPNSLAVTPVGNAQISTAQSKWSGSSMFFDGSGDRLSLAANSTLFSFGADDFTIECWFYLAGNSPLSGANTRTASLCSGFPTTGTITGYNFYIAGSSATTGTALGFESVQAGANSTLSATVTVTQGAWHHAAVSRRGTVTRVFLDGVCVAAGTLGNQTVSNANPLMVGGTQYAGYPYDLNGYIDDFRISKVARYTASFTPPQRLNTGGADPNFANTSLLLPFDEPVGLTTFTDASPNAVPVTTVGTTVAGTRSRGSWTTSTPRAYGGSVYFDGTVNSNVQTLPVDVPLVGDFTLECWFNAASSSAALKGLIVGGDYSLANRSSVGLFLFGSTVRVNRSVSGSATTVMSATVPIGTWNHVALVRSSGYLTLLVNGAAVGVTLDSTRYYDRHFDIGFSSTDRYIGYMQDARLYAGVAKYPVIGYDPAFNYVTMLLHCEGDNGSTTIADSSFAGAAVTANGNAQLTTARSRWGGGSLLLDGTGDFLTWSGLSIGTSEDFTLECWVYKTAVDASGYSSLFSGADVGNTLFNVDQTTTGSVSMTLRSTVVIAPVGTAVAMNTWNHIAYTRQGSTCRIFVNGVLQGSGTSTSAFLITYIGAWYGGGGEFNGNMDDIRITKGFSRYTTNFTPPTGPFSDTWVYSMPSPLVT